MTFISMLYSLTTYQLNHLEMSSHSGCLWSTLSNT